MRTRVSDRPVRVGRVLEECSEWQINAELRREFKVSVSGCVRAAVGEVVMSSPVRRQDGAIRQIYLPYSPPFTLHGHPMTHLATWARWGTFNCTLRAELDVPFDSQCRALTAFIYQHNTPRAFFFSFFFLPF